MTALALLALYGLTCVAVTLGWQEFLDRRAKLKVARAECERIGHNFGAPFPGVGDLHRNCTRCGFQQHYHRETDSWS